MNIADIITFIDKKRIEMKVHKTTLCAGAGISVTYYNMLLEGSKSPSHAVLSGLLAHLGFAFIIIPAEFAPEHG